MGKTNCHLVLEEKIMKALKQYIMSKTGDFKKGDLSKWVVIAIKDLIREDKQHQQHAAYDKLAMSKDQEMIDKLTDLMKEIKSLLWNDPKNPLDITCGNICHEKTLKNAISKIRGQDPRTPKKWIQKLLEFGFIRKAANNQYKILNDGHESYDVKQERKEEFDSVMENLKLQK